VLSSICHSFAVITLCPLGGRLFSFVDVLLLLFNCLWFYRFNTLLLFSFLGDIDAPPTFSLVEPRCWIWPEGTLLCKA
jgi:hypothetical protein